MKEINVLIWGTGFQAKVLMDHHICIDSNIIGFIDSYKKEDLFYGYPVYVPEKIENVGYDYIIISVEISDEILQLCGKLNVLDEKIIVVHNYHLECVRKHDQDELKIKETMPSLYKKITEIKIVENTYKNVYPCKLDMVDSDMLIGKGRFSGEYVKDYMRYRCFELVVKEIKELNITDDWAVAELGVFRGAFSALINAHFPDKDIYMFDTFEGFDAEEAKQEIAQGHCDEEFVQTFKKTSIDIVLDNMPVKERCIIRKGFFPGTSIGLENIKYGFVSIDVDFEKSIYEGLKYFYPRMIQGGVIFVHDYNFNVLQGVRKAVKQFESDFGLHLKKLPLPDSCGTLAILV